MAKNKTSVLKTTVEEEAKARFCELAKERGLSESALLRSIILQATADRQNKHEKPAAPADEEQTINVRPCIRIPAFLFNTVKNRAEQKGMTAVQWIKALIQSNLTHSPVMTEKEIINLQASLRELIAIGRNISQIARALNLKYETPKDIMKKLDILKAAITRHRLTIRKLVKSSNNNWSAD